MRFGAIVIGDEIMSGKRQDKHMPQAIATLAKRGHELSWCEHLGDDPELITEVLVRTLASDDIVFSFGGIGATPDDHTRLCAARATGMDLLLHPDAEREIRARFPGHEATPQRLAMGEFPRGAAIIPNPFNRIPGFSLGRHYFLPGFPQMAWPMMEWVLDTHYRDLARPGATAEQAIIVRGAGESQIIELMEQCGARHPGLKVFSLPRIAPDDRHIELGVRGVAAAVPDAIVFLKQGVTALGFTWSETK